MMPANPRRSWHRMEFVSKQATELGLAVRFRVLLNYFGQLCLVLAALTVVPLVMSVIFCETRLSLRYDLAIGGLAALGGSLARLRAPTCVQAKQREEEPSA